MANNILKFCIVVFLFLTSNSIAKDLLIDPNLTILGYSSAVVLWKTIIFTTTLTVAYLIFLEPTKLTLIIFVLCSIIQSIYPARLLISAVSMGLTSDIPIVLIIYFGNILCITIFSIASYKNTKHDIWPIYFTIKQATHSLFIFLSLPITILAGLIGVFNTVYIEYSLWLQYLLLFSMLVSILFQRLLTFIGSLFLCWAVGQLLLIAYHDHVLTGYFISALFHLSWACLYLAQLNHEMLKDA